MKSELVMGLAKGFKPAVVKGASAELDAGTYTVDELVRVRGTVRKAEDEDADATVSLSLLETLALTLHYAGATRESAKDAIRKAVADALADDSKTKGELLAKYDWLEDEVTAIKKEVIAKLPKITKKGKVTTKIEFSVVGTEQEKTEAEGAKVTA